MRASAAACCAAGAGGGPSTGSVIPPRIIFPRLIFPQVRLVDGLYGLDVALPLMLGSVRLVTWYSPSRNEGSAELRLLESF